MKTTRRPVLETSTTKTIFLSTLWRRPSGDQQQVLPFYSSSVLDENKEDGAIESIEAEHDQPKTEITSTAEQDEEYEEEYEEYGEDDDYYSGDDLPVYLRPTRPSTTKKDNDAENDYTEYEYEYDGYDEDPLPGYSRPESSTQGFQPIGSGDFEEELPTYSRPPPNTPPDEESVYFYDDDVLPVYSKPLPAESTTAEREEEATTTQADIVFPEISLGPLDPTETTATTKTTQNVEEIPISVEDSQTRTSAPETKTTPSLTEELFTAEDPRETTARTTTLQEDIVFPEVSIESIPEDPEEIETSTQDGSTTPFIVFPSNTIEPLVDDPFATSRPLRTTEPPEEFAVDFDEEQEGAGEKSPPSLSTSGLGITIPDIFTVEPTESTTRDSMTSEAGDVDVAITLEPKTTPKAITRATAITTTPTTTTTTTTMQSN